MKDSSINGKRIAKNTGYMFFRMFLVLVVTLYTSRIVLRSLGVEDFGIYNVVGSVVVFFSFLQTALTNATYRYIAFDLGKGNEEELKQTYSMAINCHIMLAIILFVVIEFFGLWFIDNKLNIPIERLAAAKSAFHFSMISFVVSIVITPFRSNIIAHEKMSFYALVSILEVSLRLGVAYALYLTPFDRLISYSALLSITSIVLLVMYFSYCVRSFKDTKYIKCWEPVLMKKFLSYSSWSIVVNGADVASQQSISIFLNLFIGVVANASLGIAQQINNGINSFLSSFTQSFNPQIIKTYAAEDYSSFHKLLYSTSKISYVLIFLVSVPVVINVEYILGLWLGDYPEMTPEFVRVMIIYWLFDASQYPLWQAVYATGNIKTHQIMIGGIKLLAIPFAYVILKLGGNGAIALLSWSLLNGICALCRTLYLKKLINFDVHKYLTDVVVKIFLLTIVVVPSTFFLYSFLGSTLKSFIVTSLWSILSTSLLTYFLVFNVSEKSLLNSMVFSKFKKRNREG